MRLTLVPLGVATCSACPWVLGGAAVGGPRLHLTVAVEATFALVDGTAMRLTRGEGAPDLAPFRPAVDVLLAGASVFAGALARIAIVGDEPIVDRTGAAEELGRTPLAARLAKLSAKARDGLSSSVPVVLPGIDPGVFQAAAPSQRAPALRGDEWVKVERVGAAPWRIRSRLPGARAEARVAIMTPGGRVVRTLALPVDRLVIDASRGVCVITFRSSLPIEGEAAAMDATVFGRVVLPGAITPWPPASEGDDERAPEPNDAVDETVVLGIDSNASDDDECTTTLLEADPETVSSEVSSANELAPAPTVLLGDETWGAVVATPFWPAMAAPALAPGPIAAVAAGSWSGPEEDTGTVVLWDSDAAPSTPLPFVAASAVGGEDAPLAQLRPSRAPVPVVRRTSLEVATIAWQVRPPRPSITVVVKGSFDVVPGDALRLRAICDYPTGDLPAGPAGLSSPRYPSDFAVWKPRADVMLVGHAVLRGEGAPRASVTLAFGHEGRGFRRTIGVFGPRTWSLAGPREPAPFTRVALAWENAFGGAGYAANPAGVGMSGDTLPALEDPSALITSRRDRPSPACFAPIGATWPARAAGLGTYDARWRADRWPYFPEDFRWAHFQAAPPEQQLPWLEGDEPFTITGAHADHPVLRGALPGLRPRCFAIGAAGGRRSVEVALQLDTVLFDTDALTAQLVWRGVVEVSAEGAPELGALMVTTDARATLEDAIRWAREGDAPAEAPPDPEVSTTREVAAARKGPPPPAVAAAASAAPPDPEEPDPLQALRAKLAAIEATLPRFAPAILVAPLSPGPTVEEQLAELTATLGRAGVGNDVIASMRDLFQPPPEPAPAPVPAPVPAPAPDVPIASIAAPEIPAVGDGIDLAYRSLDGADLSGRNLRGANLRGASLEGARLDGADLQGANLSDANLRGASIAGATLDHADLHGATLERAVLDGASIEGADLSGVHAEEASLRAVRGDHARFVGASLERACFDDASLPAADFTRANLAGASFAGAALPAARLTEVRGRGASFRRADLTAARCDRADLAEAAFHQVRAKGSGWGGAHLDGASFLHATLAEALFTGARCAGTVFSCCELSDARFDDAILAGASMLRANLFRASLEGADLRAADLRGANLYGVGAWRAQCDGIRLEGALIAGSSLESLGARS